MANLEDVFRLSGIPTYTFVEPQRYQEIRVSVRTAGRCSVVEGPSGIGKTTTINNVLKDLGLNNVINLSARRPADIEYIEALPGLGALGTVIVDDFHRLPDSTKNKLSDFMKVLADTEDDKSKLILIGINKAGQQLVKFAHDLGLRIDIFRLEANPIESLEQLIHKGEIALNVKIPCRVEIATMAQGSFQITQLLCHKICVLDSVTESSSLEREINTSVNVAVEDVMGDLGRQFKDTAIAFARGSKLRREGRAPYLHMLKWLSESEDWSLDLAEAMRVHLDMRASIGQVLDKGYLGALLNDEQKDKDLGSYFHYEASTRILSVEDPKLIFWLKNVIWRVFTRQAGYYADYFTGRYDFALSFAGADRAIAKQLHAELQEREVPTFYDESEQHRIIAENVEDYLAPIYRSEARYVVVLQSTTYPTRIWTKFESDAFRERFGSGSIIPIRFTDVREGFFSEESKYGGLPYDPAAPMGAQVSAIVDTLCRRLDNDRSNASAAKETEASVPIVLASV